MARIEKTIDINRPADDVWKVVGDFGAISTWLPAIAASSFAGGVRECSIEGGGMLREEIATRDDANRRYEYTITDAPFPLDAHGASMSVVDNGAGSTVTWITEIEPDDLADLMEPLFEDGIHSLKAHLESA
jgi:mxaD protein